MLNKADKFADEFAKTKTFHMLNKTNEFAKMRIGEKKVNNSGVVMEIIDYQKYGNITVKFETGEIRYKMSYKEFSEGAIQQVPDKEKRLMHIGESMTDSNGMLMKITEYNAYKNIQVQFEDGMIAKSNKYLRFKKGKVTYPKDYNTLKIGKLAYHAKGKWAFYVKCTCCGLRDVMTYEQMQKHVCNNNLN